MLNSRWAVIAALGTALLLVVLWLRFGPTADTNQNRQDSSAESTTEVGLKRQWSGRVENATAGLQHLQVVSSIPEGDAASNRRPLNPDFDANLRSAIEVIIKATPELKDLSNREIQLLIDDFLLFQEIRFELERRLVRKIDNIDGVQIFELPAYPEPGAIMEQMLHAQLREDFPPEKYNAISLSLGPYFDAYFNYFGDLRKTLHVSSAEGNGKIRIYWTSERDNSTPSNPKSALAKDRVVDATGTAIIDAGTVGSGEYGYLDGILE